MCLRTKIGTTFAALKFRNVKPAQEDLRGAVEHADEPIVEDPEEEGERRHR